jgi:septal ring factor EnvC (AmiA/AmiB activator)
MALKAKLIFQLPHKMRPYFLFFLVAMFSFTLFEPVQAASQENSEKELAKLKTNISKINRWLSRANTEKTGLSTQLENQEQRINQISKDIRHSNSKINQHTRKLQTLQSQFKTQKKSLNKQKAFLIKQLQTAYLYGEQSDLKLLLNSDNPQELALDMRLFKYISNARSEKIASFENILSDIEETRSAMLTQKKHLSEQRTRQENNYNKLKKEQKQRKKVLNQLNARIQNNSQRLEKLKADQKRLENLLVELETAIANIPLPNDAVPFHEQKTKLPWPSHGKVIGRFGSRIAQGKLKRNGILIATKEDQAVKSIHYGRVIFSNWIRGFGLLIIIDHGNNYMSLYGGNKSLTKETGEWVRAGEIIAYSTQSITKNESGLYFEIRKNGKPQNPNYWLRK